MIGAGPCGPGYHPQGPAAPRPSGLRGAGSRGAGARTPVGPRAGDSAGWCSALRVVGTGRTAGQSVRCRPGIRPPGTGPEAAPPGTPRRRDPVSTVSPELGSSPCRRQLPGGGARALSGGTESGFPVVRRRGTASGTPAARRQPRAAPEARPPAGPGDRTTPVAAAAGPPHRCGRPAPRPPPPEGYVSSGHTPIWSRSSSSITRSRIPSASVYSAGSWSRPARSSIAYSRATSDS